MKTNPFAIILPCLIVLGLIYFNLGGTAFTSITHYLPYGDKIGHFGLYGILGFGLFWMLKSSRWKAKAFWLALISAVSIAVIDEGIQSFLPYRSFDFWDFFASVLGIFSFVLAGRMILK